MIRLDHYLIKRYPNISRSLIQKNIKEGNVTVDNKIVKKPGKLLTINQHVTLLTETWSLYVSRGGYKLADALDKFSISVADKIALDAGISTGGFTDCLLQRGIRHVYGIEIGKDQVHDKIKSDQRVTIFEGMNIKNLESLPELVDLMVLDLSFISLTKVIDMVKKNLKKDGILVTLIKPQFELERSALSKQGIVIDDNKRQKAVVQVVQAYENVGFIHQGTIESPLLGGSGNREYLAYFFNLSSLPDSRKTIN